MIAPPIGGALYNRFGYRGPFVFAILVAFFDLVGRLLVIERKDARKWGHDPGRGLATEVSIELERELSCVFKGTGNNQRSYRQADCSAAARV